MTLLERLEAASEGSRELDIAIAEEVLGLIVEQIDCVNDTSPIREYSVKALHSNVWRNLPYYTTSLDAALALVPDGYEWLRKSPQTMTVYRIPADDKEWAQHIDARGATPALALTIACLKAREAQQTDKEE